ncbi:MAG: amidophosphoribosyltransferase [Cyanobacteria bacterium SZAS LIN-3]|nr:amidophosphoribosyltransferase [Cyanobacteria bacterium SZAS LIN-3]
MCGVIAISGTVSSAYEVFFGLMNLQHRGQDGAGILAVDSSKKDRFHMQKGSGLIETVFSERSFQNLHGTAALGHTRYATVGRNDPNMLQPFLDFEAGLALAHNGNIVNYYDLRGELKTEGEGKVSCVSDSELMLRIIINALAGRAKTAANIFDAVGIATKKLVGSYSVACVTESGDIFGFRDPNGIRPLVFGEKKLEDGRTEYGFASETVALEFLGFDKISEVGAGEVVFVSQDGKVERKVVAAVEFNPCMFEWVYFARVESEISNMSVYNARFQLGLLLAQQIKDLGIEADVVIPVPETSRIAGGAVAEALDLPFRELLIKNRYVNRTFILDDQHSRQEAIRRKLFPIAAEIKGKRCLIVDDSIVRGNTAMQIVKLVRQAGAREVILVSTCPPIAHACYYGIDFPSEAELIASGRDEKAMAKELGADRVVFQTIDGLKAALEQKQLCTGCLTGTYPTNVSFGVEFRRQRLKDRHGTTEILC